MKSISLIRKKNDIKIYKVIQGNIPGSIWKYAFINECLWKLTLKAR